MVEKVRILFTSSMVHQLLLLIDGGAGNDFLSLVVCLVLLHSWVVLVKTQSLLVVLQLSGWLMVVTTMTRSTSPMQLSAPQLKGGSGADSINIGVVSKGPCSSSMW